MNVIPRKLVVAALGAAPIVALPLVGGCEHDHHGTVVAVEGRQTYAYEPGYYYDNEYYDPAGHFHRRNYYYYDGHRWANRDGIPSGYTARERHEAHERHEIHALHHDRD